jgi:catechol 2,3-dioxygenase-like lactoylglutathione lyase family enzyme
MSKAVVTFAANNELALHVPDPDAAEVFYVRVLGCNVVSRSPDCVALTSGALRLYLLTTLQAAGCTLVPIGPHAPGEHYVRDPHGVVFDVIERSESGARKTGGSATEPSHRAFRGNKVPPSTSTRSGPGAAGWAGG